MSLDVLVRGVPNNVTETERHITYTCNGSEANLTECIARDQYSFVCSKVGEVTCQGLYISQSGVMKEQLQSISYITSVPEDQKECTNEGNVQLVTGSEVSTAQGRGRVEICSSIGLWGTICNDEWSSEDARVVCRALGFNAAGAY